MFPKPEEPHYIPLYGPVRQEGCTISLVCIHRERNRHQHRQIGLLGPTSRVSSKARFDEKTEKERE